MQQTQLMAFRLSHKPSLPRALNRRPARWGRGDLFNPFSIESAGERTSGTTAPRVDFSATNDPVFSRLSGNRSRLDPLVCIDLELRNQHVCRSGVDDEPGNKPASC